MIKGRGGWLVVKRTRQWKHPKSTKNPSVLWFLFTSSSFYHFAWLEIISFFDKVLYVWSLICYSRIIVSIIHYSILFFWISNTKRNSILLYHVLNVKIIVFALKDMTVFILYNICFIFNFCMILYFEFTNIFWNNLLNFIDNKTRK